MQGVLAAAASIAGVTLLARFFGLGRVYVLAQTVGQTCLGSTYVTANTVPNIVFEIVAGGALASLVVPVLAGSAARGDTATTGRVTSALLCWTVLLLLPFTLVGLLVARPVMSLLVGTAPAGCDRSAMIGVGTSMLVVFLPQVVLYGLGIVLTGVLQAHRRFLGPALAPLLSSVVVIGTYLGYGAQVRAAGGRAELAALPVAQQLLLSLGTTAGVAALSLSLLVPLARLRLPLRPTLSFPPGVGRRVGVLAGAGVAGLAAQQLSVAVVLKLANAGAPTGTVNVWTYANTLFLLPWSVLAVPIATSAFPTLASRAESGDEVGYARLAATSLRAVVLVSLLASAVLVTVAAPAARVLVLGAPGVPSVEPLTAGIIAFAPGLVGYALLALLGRALYARGDGRTPAVATVVGWLVVVVADLVAASLLPAGDRVLALGIGNTTGMVVAGVLLLVGLARATGGAGLAGLPRTGGAGLVGAVVAVPVGLLTLSVVGAGGVGRSIAAGLVVAVVTAVTYAIVVAMLDRSDLTALLRSRGRRA